MGKKLPYFPFYPGDWLKDPLLTFCSSFVRGLLIDIFCFAFECPERAVLKIAGKAMTREQLAESVRGNAQENHKGINQLIDLEIIKLTDNGTMYLSRMVREEDIREKRAAAGRASANSKQNAQQTSNKSSTNAQQNGNKSGNKKSASYSSSESTPIVPTSEPVGFTEFWESYPKKKNKGDARKAWKKLKPSSELRGEIMAAVEEQKSSLDWTREDGQFIPYPASWLRAEGWSDQAAPSVRPVEPIRHEAVAV